MNTKNNVYAKLEISLVKELKELAEEKKNLELKLANVVAEINNKKDQIHQINEIQCNLRYFNTIEHYTK